MDQFVSECLDVLGRVHAVEDLQVLQELCFTQKNKLHAIVPAMNAKMRLEKYKNPESYRFWELVPIVAGGSPKEFIILSAEPHAGPQGKRAHEWCTDLEHYL